jgi:hypothetical protein
MKTLKTELARLDNEMAARRAGLIAAAGRIAEAETLAEAINSKVNDRYYTTTAPVVTSHRSGEVNVRVLVMANHGQARVAIQALGWSVASEDEGNDTEAVTSIIHLRDFSTEIHMYREPAAITEAA